MQITETITRDCCSPLDMRPVDGTPWVEASHSPEYTFCRHCGRWRRLTDQRDSDGNVFATYEPVPLPWGRP